MDLWLLYGLVLFISYLTALLWRKWGSSSKAKIDAAASSEGTKSSSEQEKPRSDVIQEKDKETLTAASPKVDEEDKNGDTSAISPEKLEPPGKTDELSIASGKNLGDDRIDESENAEHDAVISSKSLSTEVAEDICKESLDTSLEDYSDEIVHNPEDSPNPENSLLFVESTKAQRVDLLPGPTDEVQNKTECNLTFKELENDAVSEGSLSLHEKPESFGVSAVSTDVKIESEVTSKKFQRHILNAESPGISVEEITLETPLKESEENKETEDDVQTVLGDELTKEKSVGDSADKVEEKETGEGSGTAEAETAYEFHSKADDKQVASIEVSDTSDVIEPFSESRGEEDRSVIQESAQKLLTELENSQDGHFPCLEPCGDSLKAAEQRELSLEACSKVIDDLSKESSKPDEELSQIKQDQRELGSAELLPSTHIEDKLTDGYSVEKEFEQLTQGQLSQELVTKGNLLQEELAEEKPGQTEQLQEELVAENKTTGDILISHEEALQETPGPELSEAEEEEALLADALRTRLESKNSLEEIVEAPSDQNDSVQKSVALLEKTFCDTEPDFGACFESESIKATQTDFCTSELQSLNVDKPSDSSDQALEILSEPLSSSACADVDGDPNKTEGLLHSDFSILENVSELKVVQDAKLSSSPEEFYPAHNLKQSITSSENKEAPFDVRSLVDVEEKLTTVDSGSETDQQLNLEGFSDNFGNPCVISDRSDIISYAGNSSDIISECDGILDRSFVVIGSAAEDLSHSTSKLTDSAADSCSFEIGKLDTAFTTENPCIDTETDHLAGGNLLQSTDKELETFDRGTLYSSLNKQSEEISYAEPIIVTSENTEGERGVELQENTVHQGEDIVEAREISTEITSQSTPVFSSGTDVVGVTSALKLEENTDISGLEDDRERDNICEVPAKENIQDILTPESPDIPDILAEGSGQEIREVLDEEIGEEISQEKISRGLQQVPDILAEVDRVLETSLEKNSEEFQQVPDIFAEGSGREPQTFLEISTEKDCQLLQQVPEILAEGIVQGPSKILDISLEGTSEERHQVSEILDEAIIQGPSKILDISLEGTSEERHQVPEILDEAIIQGPSKILDISLEGTSEERHQVPEILDEAIIQGPSKILDISLEGTSEERHQVSEILDEEIIQKPSKILDISLEGTSEERHQVSEILDEEIIQKPSKILNISLEGTSEERHQVPEILDEEIIQKPSKILDISLEENSEESHQVPEILDEAIIQKPSKILDISLEESSEESHQVTEVLGKEIVQEPSRILDISLEGTSEESDQVPEVLGKEIIQEPSKILDISIEESSEESHQVPEILDEEIIQKPYKILDISLEESSEESHQVPEILGKAIIQEPSKILDISLEGTSEESDQVPEVLGKAIIQEPSKILDISLEESSEESHQVPEILDEKIIQKPSKILDISLEESSEESHQVPEILDEEIIQKPSKILNISLEESSEESHQVPEILDEEIIQKPSKILNISLEESSEESHQVTEVLGKEIVQEPSRILDISLEGTSEESDQVPEVLGKEIIQEPSKILDISLEESSEESHQVPEILDEEIIQKPSKILDISLEGTSEERHQVPEILDEAIIQGPSKILDISLEGTSEERHQVPEILDEAIIQGPSKILDISLEGTSEERHQVSEILDEEIIQKPSKILDISLEGTSEERHQVSEILDEEIIQKPSKILNISLEGTSEERHQVPEILDEEIIQKPSKILDISLEESSEERHQVPEVLDEEIIQKPSKILDISLEESSEESHQVPEILDEEIIQKPSKILDISLEESSEESHQVTEVLGKQIIEEPTEILDISLHSFPEILSGEVHQEPHELHESLLKENSQALSQIPEILGEAISQLPQKVPESSLEENSRAHHRVPENLSGEIGQEPREDLNCLLGEDSQGLHQFPDSLVDENNQLRQQVQGSSLEENSPEVYQVPGNSSERCNQEAAEAAGISAEENSKEPETDKVFSQDRSKLLVHQLEMTAQSQIRFMALNLNENNESQVFRLEKGWTLQFFLGPTLANRTIRLFVDHPLQGEAWDKNSYRELEWSRLPALQLDVCEGHADVVMTQAGSFRYYFTVDDSDSKDHANGCGFFLVDPDLVIGKSQEKLPLDGIICQTVMSKLLGPFPEWEGRLRVAKETGYNVIHFTPLQELGASNSAYALRDQQKLNPVFQTTDRTFDFDDVERLVETLNNEYELLSFTDLVLNHTANESPWISEHPECVFNLVNSPHLKPAYLLDRCLRMFSANVADGLWEHEGIPSTLNSEEHLECIATVLHASVLPELRLSEFYQVSVDDVLNSFRRSIADGSAGDDEESELRIIPDPEYRRLRSTVNLSVAIRLFYSSQSSDVTADERIRLAMEDLRGELERLNARADAVTSEHLSTAVRNFVANARYRFVDANGLRLSVVTREQPIMNRYFVNSHGYLSLEEEEKLMHSEKAAYCMAHNGWIHNITDPLVNFAETGSNVYLRRELTSWEDSVKLRYGCTPADCPFLWELMRKYVVQTARIFHGVRLDNCHNTPIHVVEWMLAECRAVRPDLYVMAELFTPSTHFDNIYINRLGLNAMIREALGAGDARDLGNRLVGCSSAPVGAFFQLPLRPLTSSLIHDLLFDQTHDNPSIVDQRTVLDVLPNAALVAMAKCAVASTRGYDEVVPHHISVTSESRLFRSWSANDVYDGSDSVGIRTGIIAAKRALNKLHWTLTTEGFSQMAVEHLTDDIVVVTRHNPITHESIVLVAHTAFRRLHPDSATTFLPSLPVQGRLCEVILEAQVVADATKAFVPSEKYICGLDGLQLIMRENIDVSESQMVRVESRDNSQIVEFVQFPASSVIAFRVSLDDSTDNSLAHLRHLLACFGYKMRPPVASANDIVSTVDGAELEEIFTELTLSDLNLVLYRCDAEEKDDGYGYGAYHVPGFGDLPFCGLAGVMSVLVAIRASNNLDHPLCRNLREGNWMLDYLSSRLRFHHGTKRLGTWLETQFGHIKNLPRSLVPCYFDAFTTGVFVALEELVWNKMSDFVTKGSAFVRALALASLQLCGVSRSASLPGLSPHLDPPIQTMIVDAEGHPQTECVTIAAGLPHFSSGSFRCWGRDTFVSMRGLLLVTGRFDEARFLILAFAGYLRHGLIPNFLGCDGLGPRYNSRDAVWWWLQAIQDYCHMAPHGISILKDKVSRCYPADDSSLLPPGACDQSLCDVIQEALQKHASGVKFRERDAGPKIDNDMKSAGFDVEFGIDWTTGFVFGGNEHNCGTWMDKMGSSQGAGNLGKPGTPRHGSAVEIVGLCYSAVKWLDDLSQRTLYPYAGVSVLQDDVQTQVTFRGWCELIAKNFEPMFWIDPQNDPHSELVNRRGIYRDVFRCSHRWSEYQLRPNFTVAVALAPDLFNMDHAWAAVEQAGEVLMGPLGLKTLDPGDWEYTGFYDNSHWSLDFKTACGFSYHQGPEWIWLVGFFLRAMMQVAKRLEDRHDGILRDTISNVRRILSTHHTFIHVSDWKSLPELTNENGEFCAASCPSQAWSIACILDSLYDAEKILQTTPIIDNDQ